MEDISRRSFLTGAVAVAGIAATAGLAGCAPQQTSEATAGSSAQAAPAGSGKTTIGQTPAWLGDAPQIEESDIGNTMEPSFLSWEPEMPVWPQPFSPPTWASTSS